MISHFPSPYRLGNSELLASHHVRAPQSLSRLNTIQKIAISFQPRRCWWCHPSSSFVTQKAGRPHRLSKRPSSSEDRSIQFFAHSSQFSLLILTCLSRLHMRVQSSFQSQTSSPHSFFFFRIEPVRVSEIPAHSLPHNKGQIRPVISL